MSHHSIVSESTQRELIHEVSPSDVEKCIDACKAQFNQIFSIIPLAADPFLHFELP